MKRLDALGKWTAFKAVLSSMPAIVQDAWTLAQYISNKDSMFLDNKEALKSALVLTEEEFNSLFE